ncbi:Choline transport protein [Exophiala dermatitidis]
MADDESVQLGGIYSNDDALQLAMFGKKQQMKRYFNGWSLLFMSFCTSVTWEALSSTMAQALTAGGSSSMVWGFLASAVGTLLIALSISEYASIIPTSGGQYDYVTEMSPPRFRRIFSWTAGWITIWGWILSGTSGIFANAMQIQAYVILFKPDYVYERWHTSLILIGLATVFASVGIFGIKWLAKLQYFGIALHISGYIATIVYLLVKVHPKNTADFVFADFTNLSGWKSDGVAWSIGLLSSAIGFVNWDSSSHMAEEMKHAARDLPRAMYGCVLVTGVLTFPWVIALMFCITDLDGVLNGPVGLICPLVQLMYNVSGGELGSTLGMTIFFLLLSSVVAGPSVITAISRIIWSFAREGGMPKFMARVDERQHVPVNALIFTWLCVCALACVYIGNSTAFYGLSSGTTAVLVVSYCMPILIHVIWGLEPSGLKPGPFTLGKWSKPINYGALAWSTYLITFLCFPTTMPTTAATMNYSCLVLGFGFVLAGVTWFLYGKKLYRASADEVDYEETEVALAVLQNEGHGKPKSKGLD